ncbi:uncharacterized protein LOC120414132 [Culex pipiens pallens]|uniref:uncharacterized protein LOC120414131 n=1 Tax=Culex pipiens pallens TaxID=42434 RepID=UPI0019531C15|nr:uncharacterized protein LOC120414131 [Culex pipiens pallens]XP_039431098.1 uncharacterized protein LOC120414132 [Culex pipiens pallens]
MVFHPKSSSQAVADSSTQALLHWGQQKQPLLLNFCCFLGDFVDELPQVRPSTTPRPSETGKGTSRKLPPVDLESASVRLLVAAAAHQEEALDRRHHVDHHPSQLMTTSR